MANGGQERHAQFDVGRFLVAAACSRNNDASAAERDTTLKARRGHGDLIARALLAGSSERVERCINCAEVYGSPEPYSNRTAPYTVHGV